MMIGREARRTVTAQPECAARRMQDISNSAPCQKQFEYRRMWANTVDLMFEEEFDVRGDAERRRSHLPFIFFPPLAHVPQMAFPRCCARAQARYACAQHNDSESA